MKMIFAADEMVKVREKYCGTWEIRKQEIADFLIQNSGEEVLERAVILSNLTNVISIEVINFKRIDLYPIGIKMLVDESIINFLHSKSKYH